MAHHYFLWIIRISILKDMVNMKNLARAITLFLCLIFIALPQSLAQASFPVDYQENAQVMGTCPPVQNTPFFTIAYGTVTLNGSNASIGSVVKAWSPRNDLVGCFVVSSTGNYGAMYIYGEDTSVIPSIPGMRANEPVSFTINDIPATPTPTLLWANDKDLHAINLASEGVLAAFSATPVSGVFPLAVQFSDASTGSISSWLWNFGDGQTSTEQNPQHTYIAAGSYTVSLTVNGPSGSDTETKTAFVNVYTPVSANFSANQTSGIAPLSVTFTNSSTGDYTSTNWTFGDGGTSSSLNPVHVYTTGGTYAVSLTVSGPGGSDTETKTNYITVYTPATANFTATPTTGIAPLSVNFTNTSSGDYTSLSWNFGDGNTSNEVNPTHVYTTKGIYTVSLTVSGLGGDDTETKTGLITVYENVSTQFNGIPTSGIAPLTVDFTNQTSGDFTSQSWSFGDGGTSDLLNPSHVYMTGGTYDVSLTAIGPGGTDTETKTNYITVYTPVVAGFAASPTSGVGPLQVAFTNQSTGSFTELSWDFGDGNTGSEVNPVHTYTEDGVYTVTLTASGPGGTDIETYTDYITVYQAVNAEFSADLTSGIAPLEVHFTNLSTGDYTTSSWDFGDGGTSTDANPTHVYSAGGSFTVTLTVSGNGGTDQEIKTTYISVYSPVIADFTYTPVNGIAPLTVQFTNTSSGDYDTLAWNFGDGSPTSNEVNPAHVFEAGGTYTISLTASGAGGQGIQTHSVEVFAPVEAAFSSNVTSGVAPLNVEFTNESIGDFDTVLWDFGDLNSSNLPNPIHTYETPGIYTVMLTVSGSGGNDAEIKTDYIVVYEAAIADFSADTFSGIAPYTISFTDQSVGDYDTWWWDFGDGNTGVEASPQHQYISPGIYTVSLTVSGNGGSNTETKTDYITIYEPITVDFSAEPISGVAPTTVAFSSNITGDYNSVGWDFGDGGTSEEVTLPMNIQPLEFIR